MRFDEYYRRVRATFGGWMPHDLEAPPDEIAECEKLRHEVGCLGRVLDEERAACGRLVKQSESFRAEIDKLKEQLQVAQGGWEKAMSNATAQQEAKFDIARQRNAAQDENTKLKAKLAHAEKLAGEALANNRDLLETNALAVKTMNKYRDTIADLNKEIAGLRRTVAAGCHPRAVERIEELVAEVGRAQSRVGSLSEENFKLKSNQIPGGYKTFNPETHNLVPVAQRGESLSFAQWTLQVAHVLQRRGHTNCSVEKVLNIMAECGQPKDVLRKGEKRVAEHLNTYDPKHLKTCDATVRFYDPAFFKTIPVGQLKYPAIEVIPDPTAVNLSGHRHDPETGTLHRHTSGATSSHEAIPFNQLLWTGIEQIARRFKAGNEKHEKGTTVYAEANWLKAFHARDLQFFRDRMNHAMEHFKDEMRGKFDTDPGGNWGAVGWCVEVMSFVQRYDYAFYKAIVGLEKCFPVRPGPCPCPNCKK